jgi:hypothetical protein
MAMSATAHFLKERMRQDGFIADEALLLECVNAVRMHITATAAAANLRPRDYACTYLGVVSTRSEAVMVQVGDGGIVVDIGDGLTLPVVPMSGEYANMTYFVTDEDALTRVQTKQLSAAVRRLAVFTDGIQRLAINMADNTPHAPFFSRFFEVLGNSTLQDEDKLHDALLAFLASGPVDERTDDDRTLVLASLVDA